MNSISDSALNLATGFPGLAGRDGGPDIASLANANRFAFGALDIQSLASTIVAAASNGAFDENALNLPGTGLSPVETGQLLAAIEKRILGDMGTGGAPAPAPYAADTGTGGETSPGNRAGDSTNGNRTGGMTSGNAAVAAS